MDAAVRIGVAPLEIVEALLHPVPFTGFPRVLHAIGTARAVFADHGVTVDPVVMDDDRDRYERGAEKPAGIDGRHGLDVVASLKDISPDLARYLVVEP